MITKTLLPLVLAVTMILPLSPSFAGQQNDDSDDTVLIVYEEEFPNGEMAAGEVQYFKRNKRGRSCAKKGQVWKVVGAECRQGCTRQRTCVYLHDD